MLRLLLLAGTVGFAQFSPALAKPVVPTIEQLAAFPKASGFQVSPDGRHLVGLEGRGEDRVILVWKTADLSAKPTVIGATQMKIQSVSFIKNDVLAVTLWQPYDARFDGVTKTFISKFYFTDLEGKNWREPLPLPRAKTDIDERIQSITNPTLLDDLPNDPDNILVVNNVGLDAGDVYKVNVRSNRAVKVLRSDEKTGSYVVDLEGNVRARTLFDTNSGGGSAFITTQIRPASGGGWEDHFKTRVRDRDVFNVIGFTDDPNVALIASNVGQDKIGIFEYNVATKKLGEPVFKHKFFEANRVRTWRRRDGAGRFGEITGLEYLGPSGADTLWVAPQYKALDQSIRTALKITAEPTRFVDPATGESTTAKYDSGMRYSISGASADLKTVVVSAYSATVPPTYYLLKDGQLSLLAKAFPDIDPAALGTTQIVYYKARDGLDIPALLTKPSSALCGNGPWPSVVHPHGGPWGRDDASFNSASQSWVPLLSTRCFAVLQPEFRGSQGWGRKLWMAGDAEWGQKMQDDKDDGAKWLIDQKVAVPGRIAMFGFSYGGYSAFAAAVRPNGLYKCAVAGAGVSDIKRIWAKFYTNSYFRENQAATVKGLNPVDQASQIKIPIMVFHGVRDQTVPIEQSDWFVSAAKKSGQKVVYHKIADYAHGPAWTRAINAEQLRVIDDYLTKDCGGSGL